MENYYGERNVELHNNSGRGGGVGGEEHRAERRGKEEN